ncbi:MAG: AAA family ATPase [Clostridia bacterium]|nr:AAA family ATPase [Clostridia bacterium]
MLKTFGIVSGKGGTGKSTVSYGLSVAFSKMNKSVLLVDLDEGLRCLDTIMGLDKKVTNDLSDLLFGAPIENAVYKSEIYENLNLVPAPCDTGVINYVNLSDFHKRVSKIYDIIIYDFPAGIDVDKLTAIGDEAKFIIVSNSDGISLKDAAAVKNNLPKTKEEPRIIINRFFNEFIKDGIWGSIDDMIDASGLRLIGIVPSSLEAATLSVSHKFAKNSRVFSAFQRIAKRLCGEEVLLPKINKI